MDVGVKNPLFCKNKLINSNFDIEKTIDITKLKV